MFSAMGSATRAEGENDTMLPAGRQRGLRIDLQHAGSRVRYRCNQCRRVFTRASCAADEVTQGRCPACCSDDVQQWLSTRDRVLRFLMLYEAA